MRKLVIIDGKSVFYRGYYAMPNLSKGDGTPTSGVYGFAVIAMEIVKKLQPDVVIVAWDKAGTSTAKRTAIYPEYKAGRIKPPGDFYAQIPLLRELIEALGWNFYECDEYEADDIIGTLALQADEDLDEEGDCKWMTYIVSSDLDMLQIVDENTRMYRLLKGFSELEEMDVPAVEAKYGIRKAQFLDLKALKGDSSDNIPGVPGIGEKGAVKLLNDFGDLDGVYRELEKWTVEDGRYPKECPISNAVALKLAAGKESAYMSRTLALIQRDAPVKLSEAVELKIEGEKIVRKLKELEFFSLVRKYREWLGGADDKIGDEAGMQKSKEGSEEKIDGAAVRREEQAEEVAKVEIPEGLMIEKDVKAVMHADEKLAERILKGEEYWDLNQAEFLLDPLTRQGNRGESVQVSMFDAMVTDQEKQEQYISQRQRFSAMESVQKIYREFDLPLIPVLYKMEKKGILIDRAYFERLKVVFTEESEKIEQKIYSIAGYEFNTRSTQQLSKVLFEDLGLPTNGVPKTRLGYSTKAEVLEKLKGKHEIIELILEYREAQKLLSTYVLPLPELADKDGRVHTTFRQDVTATGRLSSQNPNLQNIPVRKETGKQIRTGMVAAPGRVLVGADYAQFELRLAAAMAGDKKLVEDFNTGVDIHTKTAAEVFGVPMEEVTKDQRRAAKVVNFGVMYGMSVRGLSQATGMGFYEAKDFITNYFVLRAPIKQYLEQTLAQAKSRGYVETLYGRRRPTPDVLSTNAVVRAAAERAAQNMPIQGTEADLMKKAMIELDRRLPEGADLVLQVHDSLVVECNEGIAGEVSKILQEVMEGVAPELTVKLAVDVKVGKNLGEV